VTVGGRRGRAPGPLARLEAALDRVDERPLDGTIKNVGALAGLPPSSIAQAGFKLFDGQVSFPQLILSRPTMLANIKAMQAFADVSGAWLAPHGKSTMAPHIFDAQLRAGAWGITVATAHQALVCRTFGIGRILVANELRWPGDIADLVRELTEDPAFELLALVDDVENVSMWADAARASNLVRPVSLLAEFGWRGGRTGVRDLPSLERVVDAIAAAAPWVRPVGIEGYEGIAPGSSDPERAAAVETYLTTLADAARRLRPRFPVPRPIVSAGGSVYFDRVVVHLGRDALPEYQLVLRSGGYVTHDSGLYARSSPLAGSSDRLPGFSRLAPALTLWGVVLSRPEAGIAIVGIGHRDAPSRIDLPVVQWLVRDGTLSAVTPPVPIRRMDDQHAYVDASGAFDPMPGDLVGCGISHPCEAFERWRVVLEVDEADRIIGAIPTFF